jgi:sulfite reductase (NADPH) flavoprotein alpha-component
MDLHVADGVVTKATGRPDHPANRGRLCTKGNTTADMLRAGGRLTTALVRPERAAEAARARRAVSGYGVPGRAAYHHASGLSCVL